MPAGEHDAETWLALTADAAVPDFVVPMVELFDSPRAGDIMLVAERGWDFSPPDKEVDTAASMPKMCWCRWSLPGPGCRLGR